VPKEKNRIFEKKKRTNSGLKLIQQVPKLKEDINNEWQLAEEDPARKGTVLHAFHTALNFT
jgi:hypothetical protein